MTSDPTDRTHRSGVCLPAVSRSQLSRAMVTW